MANLVPEDLIFFQILARLPLKFLFQLTLICKCWHFLITNPGSIAFHIANASYNLHNSTSFVVGWYSDDRESGFSIVNKDHNNVLINRINDSIRNVCKQIFSLRDSMSEAAELYRVEPEQAVGVVGSVHGLVGLVCFSQNFECLYFIWNPMFKTVSKPSRELSEKIHCFRSSFCYDRIDRDFKIIEIQRYEMQLEFGKVLFRVQVYSCNLDTWREISYDSLPNSNFHIVENVKDALYVEFLSEPDVLVAFHIHDEVFKRLSCPKL